MAAGSCPGTCQENCSHLVGMELRHIMEPAVNLLLNCSHCNSFLAWGFTSQTSVTEIGPLAMKVQKV